MKSMKKKISAVLAGTLMLGSFSTAALAAPQAEKSIGVQLDGQMITLVNDAEPVINKITEEYICLSAVCLKH